MNLNIKDEETCQLAKELARLTGETMVGALTVALRERLEREKQRHDTDARVQELLAIGRYCADLVGTGVSSAEHGTLLYDEQGVPKSNLAA